ELETAKAILNNQERGPAKETKETSHPINERIDEMLHKRKQELSEKLFDTETRKSLRELKPVVDQFNLISGVANDLKKVCKELAV
ncbi:MAG: hypothetical protein JSU05_14505, partial [Bacteroidetes bacterium]|nr:hypothetical protein [Bacteroidota bacterium]